MTPTEVNHTRTVACGLWPHLGGSRGWSIDQWSVFTEQAARINVAGEQAEAALRHLLATFDGYPKPSVLIKAIKRAEAPVARTAQTAEAQALGPRARLHEMRRMPGLADGEPDGRVVQAWYIQAANRSVRIRGYVRESLWAHAHDDLIELGHWDSASASEWVHEVGTQYPSALPTTGGPA